jgi:hypothetical protein
MSVAVWGCWGQVPGKNRMCKDIRRMDFAGEVSAESLCMCCFGRRCGGA